MTVRVEVDATRCLGNGLCGSFADDVFEFDEDEGKATVLIDVVPEHRRAALELAARTCPTQAITVTAGPPTNEI